MKLCILASLILLGSLVSFFLKRDKRSFSQIENSFWERERKANSVRRKSLDDLDYIIIDLDQLPMNLLSDDLEINECIEIIQSLSTLPIVNFTGYTNTDLKLAYGTANITVLSEYDQNYTLLVRTLQKWAELLLKKDYSKEAKHILEYAISINTDISQTYYKLAELYWANLEMDKIKFLIEHAKTLTSSHKHAIVQTLEKFYL